MLIKIVWGGPIVAGGYILVRLDSKCDFVTFARAESYHRIVIDINAFAGAY